MNSKETNSQNNVSKNALILSISKVLNTLITLMSAMLLSRFRTLEEYGTYSQIQTAVGLIISVVMLGLPNSINLFLGNAKNTKEADKFLSLYYSFGTVLSVLAGLILLILTPFICSYYKNDAIQEYSYALAILPWVSVITTSISNMLVSVGATKRLLIYNFLRNLSILVTIVFVRLIDQNFEFYMSAYVIVESLFSLWVYYEAKRLTDKIYIKPDFSLLKKVLTFSIPMGVASAVGTLDIYLDHLMVGHYFDTETLAIFSNAAKELPFNIIASAFTAVLVPYMAKKFRSGENEIAMKSWFAATEFNAFILFFCATTCIVYAPQIMTILYSEKYISGVPVFRVYSLALLLRITYFGMALNALGKSKYILYSSIATLIINIIFNYAMINIIGSIGAALATVLSILIISLLQLKFTSNLLNMCFKDIFPWKRIGLVAGINTAWGVIAFMIEKWLKLGVSISHIIISILIGIIFLTIYSLIVKKRMIYLYKEMGK